MRSTNRRLQLNSKRFGTSDTSSQRCWTDEDSVGRAETRVCALGRNGCMSGRPSPAVSDLSDTLGAHGSVKAQLSRIVDPGLRIHLCTSAVHRQLSCSRLCREDFTFSDYLVGRFAWNIHPFGICTLVLRKGFGYYGQGTCKTLVPTSV